MLAVTVSVAVAVAVAVAVESTAVVVVVVVDDVDVLERVRLNTWVDFLKGLGSPEKFNASISFLFFSLYDPWEARMSGK
jgi:hypothetical protein